MFIKQLCALLLIATGTFLAVFVYSGIVVLPRSRSYIKNDIKQQISIINRIHRDNYAIPHIHASTMKEAYYGLGYVHGTDRAWQLHLRRAQGRLSELFGGKTLHIDKHIRNFGLLESSRRIVQLLDEEVRSVLQVYIDGINDAVNNLDVLPIEFQLTGSKWVEWTIYDTITFYKLLSFININDGFQEFIRTEIRDIYGKDVSDILGSIGPDNQFDANRTVLNEDEVKHRTKLWDPLGFEKGLEADTQSSTFELPPMEELFPSDLSNWLLPAFSGSNLFVIHGNHTTTGKPILASDPHLETQMPCLWYQAEIIYTHEGSEHFVIGAQLPGIPVTMSGRNQYHAWGLTILYSDSADLWQEEIIERDGKHYYRYKDELLLVRETEEVILIKGQSEPVKFNVMYTHHGAVMNSDMFRPKTRHNNSYISFQSVAPIDDHVGIRYECIGHSSGFLRFLHEKDLAQALEHLKDISYPNLGMGFASINGDIGYIAMGRLVVRSGNPDKGGYVKQGWEGSYEWENYVPKDEQPIVVNPDKGYFVLSNNKFLHSNNKYHLAWNSNPTARGRRLDMLISEKLSQVQSFLNMKGKKISPKDVFEFQNDVVDAYAKTGAPALVILIDHLLRNGHREINHLKIIAQYFKDWDGSFSRQSVAASLFMKFEYFYARTFLKEVQAISEKSIIDWGNHYIFDSFLFKNLQDMVKAIGNGDNTILNATYCQHPVRKTQYACLFNLGNSLLSAYHSLERQLGPDHTKWHWERIHTMYYPHMPFKDESFGFIFNRRFPYQGNRRTVHLAAPTLHDENEYLADLSPNYKMIVNIDDREKSYYVLDTGISGSLFSPHYDDQQRLYERGEYIEMEWGTANLKPQMQQQTLRPASKVQDDI